MKLNLRVLYVQTQITPDAALIAELQAHTISLRPENSRLEQLVDAHSVYAHQGDKPRDHRKKRTFKLDDVDCAEQRAPARLTASSTRARGAFPRGWRRLIGSLIFITNFRTNGQCLVVILCKMVYNLGDHIMSLRHPLARS